MCACVRPAAKRAASSVAPLENRLGQSLIRPSSSAAHAVGAGLVGGTRRFARSAVVLVGRRVDLAAVARRAVAVAKALVAAPDRAAARAAGGLGIVDLAGSRVAGAAVVDIGVEVDLAAIVTLA